MGQKVNPHGMRVGVIKDWDSRWFTSKQAFGDTLVEDYKIRKDPEEAAVRCRRSQDRDRAYRRLPDRCPPREGQCLLRKAGHRDRQGRC